MMLGKLPVSRRSANLDNSRARAYCACSRSRWGLFGHFFSRLLFLFFLPARNRLKFCLKVPLNPKQPTNQHDVVPTYMTSYRRTCDVVTSFRRHVPAGILVLEGKPFRSHSMVEKLQSIPANFHADAEAR